MGMIATNLYKSLPCQKFLNEIDFFNSNNRKGIGITVSPKNQILFKVYLEIKDNTELKNYKNLLEEEFYKFCKFKKLADFSKPSSYAIGKKFSCSGEEFNYYHVKFKKNYFLNDIYYKLNLLNHKKCSYGFSKEFNKDTVFRKKYIYVNDLDNKKLVNKIFNLNVDIDNINHFEIYSKNKNNYKINFILNNFLNIVLPKNVIPIVNELNDLFLKTPVYTGITNNDETSIYYSFTK